jgi:putative ABC transport system permease protein
VHEPQAIFIPATPGFLEALDVPLIDGRWFAATDDSAAPLAIVSRELVRRHFANGRAVGQRINISGVVRTIVGVVGDATYEGPAAPLKPEVYVPFAQRPDAGVWIAVRASGHPTALTTPITNALHAVDPEMNPRDLRPLDRMISDAVLRPRFQSWLLGTFGGLALLLAAVGIYGVIAYGVAQRTQEIGLRLALGAPARTVVGLILRQGMRPVVVGLAAGVVLAWWLARLMAGLLYGIGPTDTPTFITVIVVLGLVALIAAWIPARRAARVDPLTALSSGS